MSESFWRGRRAFVTGAGGFVGGWLVRQLLERGAEVAVLVRERNPRTVLEGEGLSRRVTVFHGSVEDFRLMRRAFGTHAAETVFHLAARAVAGTAKLDPVRTLKANVEGTWNVLEAARGSGVQHILVASSGKAYSSGPGALPPYRETYPLQGKHPYDVSKSCADLISTMYARTYGIKVAVLRCANVFGGGDLNFSRTIPGVIRSAVAGERFRIRSDGTAVRDFLYVKDASRAYLTAAEQLERHPELAGEAFNFTLAEPLTVLEVVSRVLRLMGREELVPIIENQANDESPKQYLSSDKARDVLGWKPAFGFEEGLRETIHWYRDYFANVEPHFAPAPEKAAVHGTGSAPVAAAVGGAAAQ